MTKMWLDCFGNTFTDEDIFEKLRTANRNKEFNFYFVVGTDSNSIKNQYKFITSVVIYKIGMGADYYYQKHFEPRSSFNGKPQKVRLFQEVEKSIETANLIFSNTGIKPIIHIDASPKSSNEFSSSFSDQLKGYAISSGYECEIKPNSFASSHVSDRHTKK